MLGANYLGKPYLGYNFEEVVNSDKWTPIYPDQTYGPGKLQHTYPTFFTSPEPITEAPVETITLDKWFTEINQPYPANKRVEYAYPTEAFANVYPPFEPIFVQSPVVITVERVTQYQGRAEPLPDVQAQVETVTIDKWFSQSPLTEPKPKLQYLHESFFGVDNSSLSVTLDKWFVGTDNPVLRTITHHLAPTLVGPLFIPISEITGYSTATVTFTKRHQYQGRAEPVLVPAEASETVTVDKWFVPLSTTHDQSRFQYLYPNFFGVDKSSLDVNLDKWFSQASEPLFIQANNNHIYLSYTQIFDLRVDLDKWAQPIQTPRSQLASRKYLYTATIFDPKPVDVVQEALITATIQTQTPYFAKPKNQYLYVGGIVYPFHNLTGGHFLSFSDEVCINDIAWSKNTPVDPTFTTQSPTAASWTTETPAASSWTTQSPTASSWTEETPASTDWEDEC